MEHGEWSRYSELCGTSFLRFKELLGLDGRGWCSVWLEYKYVWSIRGVMMDEGKADGFQVEEILWAAFAFVQPRRACIPGCTLQEPYGETIGWGKDGRMLGRCLRS